MGKVIILAGAPDAASLDWARLEETGTAAQGAGENKDSQALVSCHPQWRTVPTRDEHESPTEQHLSEHSETLQVLGEQTGLLIDSSRVGCGGSASMSQSLNETRDGHCSFSSADQTSLSVRLPDVLLAVQELREVPGLSPIPSLPLSHETTASQDFIEHTLAVHDALPSSLPDPSAFSRDVAEEASRDRYKERDRDAGQIQHYVAQSFGGSFSTSFEQSLTSTTKSSSLPPPSLPSTLPRWQPLTHLVDIPGAAELHRLAPQTVTVNIVVAVVTVSPPRAVNVRQNTRHMRQRPTSLVELSVGDETRPGFGITVWMEDPLSDGGRGCAVSRGGRGGRGDSSGRPLASLLSTLHSQDVILLRNVALHVFGDKVYGSSLRKDQTKMHILHRARDRRQQGQEDQEAQNGDSLFSAAHLAAAAVAEFDNTQTSGPPVRQLLAKTARVREWALRYVLSSSVAEGDEASLADPERHVWTKPPADTQ